MEVSFSIATDDDTLVTELFDKVYVKKGDQFKIHPNCKIIVNDVRTYRTPDFSQILDLVFAGAGNVAAGILANWLYEKLKGRKAKLVIEHREVTVDRNQIKVSLTKISKD